MNPWDLSVSDLLIWGIVLHLIADWPLQNDWMANHKALRRLRVIDKSKAGAPYGDHETVWWDRHPAAYVHAGIHGVLLALVFGWPAIFLAWVHLVIDTRVPVVWWSKLVRQTQPRAATDRSLLVGATNPRKRQHGVVTAEGPGDVPEVSGDLVLEVREDTRFSVDIGTEVRFWTDQVFHVATIAVAALLVGALG